MNDILVETTRGAVLLTPVEIEPPEPWGTPDDDVVWPPECRCGADIARGAVPVPLAVDKLAVNPVPEPGAYLARNMGGTYEGVLVVGVDEHIEREPWRGLRGAEALFATSPVCLVLCRTCAGQVFGESAVYRLIRECGGRPPE